MNFPNRSQVPGAPLAAGKALMPTGATVPVRTDIADGIAAVYRPQI